MSSRNALLLTAMVLTALLILPSLSNAQQQAANFTNPSITVLYRLGHVFLSVQWNSTSFIFLTAKAYAGTSSVCSQDTTFVASQTGSPDYPPSPGAPEQINTPSQSVFHLPANTVESLPPPVYFCVYINDSYSETANTTAVFVDPSLIPTTTSTISTTSTSTTSTASTSYTTSTINYTTSTVSTAASTTSIARTTTISTNPTSNFTTPTVNRFWYASGNMRFAVGWISMGPGQFTVKLYSGTSANCNQDTHLALVRGASTLPYPETGPTPMTVNAFLITNSMINVNQSGTVGYACIYVNGTGGLTKNTTPVRFDVSLIPTTTTTSMTSSVTTSYPTTSSVSTVVPTHAQSLIDELIEEADSSPRPIGNPLQSLFNIFGWILGLR
jgi:hypothetical protein